MAASHTLVNVAKVLAVGLSSDYFMLNLSGNTNTKEFNNRGRYARNKNN